jgi:hypothetical protein
MINNSVCLSSVAEAIGIDLHESYMKFQLGRGTPAGGFGFGDGKTEERNTKPYL